MTQEDGVDGANGSDLPAADGVRGSNEARGARLIATKKLAVRSGIEVSTRKVGSIAPGDLVIGLEQRVSSDGALRVRSAKGWVSATNLSGATLLRPAREGEGTPGSPRASAEAGLAVTPADISTPLRLPSKADLIELSGLLRPPSTVIAVLKTLCVVLEGKGTTRHSGKNGWAATTTMLKNQSAVLLKMKAVDPATLGPGIGRHLAKLINDPDFELASIAKQSKAAASVAKWCGCHAPSVSLRFPATLFSLLVSASAFLSATTRH